MSARLCMHYFVSGRVQGVGYRYFVVRVARELDLHGWVRNLDDGRVELVACAEDAVLTRLEQKLWQGPLASDVRDVVRCEVADKGLRDFVVS